MAALPARWLRRYPVPVIGASVAVIIGILSVSHIRLFENIEARLFDTHFLLRGERPVSGAVRIVAIDEKSLLTVGRWPWPRAVLADLVERIAAAGARVVTFDIILSEPDRAERLRAVEDLASRFRESPLATDPRARPFTDQLTAARRGADQDGRLESALRAADRVVLPVFFTFEEAEARLRHYEELRDDATWVRSSFTALANARQRANYPPLSARGITPTLPRFLAASRAAGHVNIKPDPDGTVRWEHLVIRHGDNYYPSLALQTARLALGVPPEKFALRFGEGVQVGSTRVPTNDQSALLINYYGGAQRFPRYSVADVLAGTVPADAFRDKIVLVGATAVGIFDLRVTPFSPVLPGVEIHANVIENILRRDFLQRPGVWATLQQVVTVALLGVGLAFLLGRTGPIVGLVAMLAGMAGVFGVAHLLFLRAGLWVTSFYGLLTVAASYAGVTSYRFLSEERQRRFIKGAFSQYLSPQVVDEIVRDPGRLRFGGERRTLSVLFSDIRGFTTFSEQHDPERVVEQLGEYLTAMTGIVFRHGGTLDKFVGDAIMAIFGAPIDYPDHALRACRAALDMRRELDRLNAAWSAAGRPPFEIGVGINTGEMVVGNLGSAQRFEYTVIGDNVNLAARLETLNKEYTTKLHIIISEFTHAEVQHLIHAEALGGVTVKGKTKPVAIYEVLGERAPQ